EQFSEHPLARAITAAAQSRNLRLPDPESFNSIPGGGVRARFLNQDRDLLAASPNYVFSQALPLADADRAALEQLQSIGHTLVLLYDLTAGSLLGVLALQDLPRADAADALRQLHSQRIQTGVLTGDNESAAKAALNAL